MTFAELAFPVFGISPDGFETIPERITSISQPQSTIFLKCFNMVSSDEQDTLKKVPGNIFLDT